VTHTFSTKLAAGSLAAIITATMSASAFAAERSSPAAPSSTLLASGRTYVQQLATTTPPRPAALARQEGSAYDEPRGFFSTKRGVALLVLAGAGIGYMWYSKSNDRIHSTARARLDN
jgi:CubicO group peptidase (beta-lactamase class C family)